MEAISAIDKYTKEKPINTMRNAQITPAVPPLVKMLARVVRRTSHVAIKVHAKPTMEVNWKFLWKRHVRKLYHTLWLDQKVSQYSLETYAQLLNSS